MAEHRKFRGTQIPERLRPLLPLLPLFLVLVTAILLWGREPKEEEKTLYLSLVTEEAPLQLVTAEQLDQMAYLDSNMGEVGWIYTEQSLTELNRVLREYEITTPEEISQFLAQAAVETAAGRWLTELGDEEYFQRYGYSTGTRGAGYLHLTFEYGQMAFATWMMKRYIPALEQIQYVSPANSGEEDIAAAYYAALQAAANLGVNVSRYSRIVFDSNSPVTTGADYIAENFAWESAGYYWVAAGIGKALAAGDTDAVSHLVGGSNWQSRREAYAAFYPILSGTS